MGTTVKCVGQKKSAFSVGHVTHDQFEFVENHVVFNKMSLIKVIFWAKVESSQESGLSLHQIQDNHLAFVLRATPENRDFNKWKFRFFQSKTCIVNQF